MNRRLILLLVTPFVGLVALTALAVGLLQTAQVDVMALARTMLGPAVPATLVAAVGWLDLPLRLVFVIVVFALAWLVTRVSWRVAGWLLRAAYYESLLRPRPLPADSPIPAPVALDRRRQTVQLLVASLINIAAFVVAFILAAGQFVSLVNLAVVTTILANAFGFAARDYVGDFLNGISNIFEDRFDVGDRVAVFKVGDTLEGIVERVTVRTLSIRTRSGELIVVPQGEVRILRNYSRGSFTGINVTVRVAPADVSEALAVLLPLADEAPRLLPDLLEPWTIVAEDGTLGEAAELLIHAKARYARGAELRLRIMMLVEERLSAAGVALG